jgi:hypothetical protein
MARIDIPQDIWERIVLPLALNNYLQAPEPRSIAVCIAQAAATVVNAHGANFTKRGRVIFAQADGDYRFVVREQDGSVGLQDRLEEVQKT